jgi:hypothetical protein
MKKIVLIAVIIIIAIGGYKLMGKNSKTSEVPENASAGFLTIDQSLNEYEKIIEFYEGQGGLKTPQDMMRFSSEIQTKFPTYNPSEMTQKEAQIIGDRLSKLRDRQMKLLNASR